MCFQMYYYQSGKDVITGSYEGRLQPPFSPATTKNASILITNMQTSDAGVYTCEVHNFPDVDGQSEVNIMVNVLGKFFTPTLKIQSLVINWSSVFSRLNKRSPIYLSKCL